MPEPPVQRVFIQQRDSIRPQLLRPEDFSLRTAGCQEVVITLQHSLDGPRRRVRKVAAKQDVRHITTYRTDKFQETSQLRRAGTQRRVIVEPREVRKGLFLRDPSHGSNGGDSQGGHGPRPNEGERPTRMGEDDIDVRAGPHRSREDQVDSSAGRSQRVVDDGLGQEAADELGRQVQARRVQEDERAVALQLLPDGPEALVAGEPVAVGCVRADAAAELLLREEEVDLGARALDVLPVGKDAEEAELSGERALGRRGQRAEVYVELARELAALLACPGDWDAGRGDG